MKIFKSKSLSLLTFSTLLCLSSATTFAQEFKWGAYVNTSVETSEADQNGATRTEMFIPVYSTGTRMDYIDLRGYLNKDEYKDLSITFGHREKIAPDTVIGANISYDKTESESGNTHEQAVLGLELFKGRTKLKVNFYKALSNSEGVEGTGIAPYAALDGSKVFIYEKGLDEEKALDGVSAELSHDFNVGKGFSVEPGVEGYYYGGSDGFEGRKGANLYVRGHYRFKVFGESVDASLRVGHNFSSSDQEKGWNAMLNFGISFGGSSSVAGLSDSTYADYAMWERVLHRNTTVSYKEATLFKTPGTIHRYGRTFTDLYIQGANDDIQNTIDKNTDGSGLIVLSNKDGDINITEGLDIKDHNVVIGEGKVLLVKGPKGQQFALVLPKNRAAFVQGDQSIQITMGSDTILDSVDLGDARLTLDGSSDVKIKRVRIKSYLGTYDPANLSQILSNLDEDSMPTVSVNGANNIRIVKSDFESNAIGSLVEVRDTDGFVMLTSRLHSVQALNPDRAGQAIYAENSSFSLNSNIKVKKSDIHGSVTFNNFGKLNYRKNNQTGEIAGFSAYNIGTGNVTKNRFNEDEDYGFRVYTNNVENLNFSLNEIYNIDHMEFIGGYNNPNPSKARFVGNKSVNSRAVITFDNYKNAKVKKNDLHTWLYSTLSVKKADRAVVAKNKLVAAGFTGIYMSYVESARISDNYIELYDRYGTSKYGIMIQDSNGINITRNAIVWNSNREGGGLEIKNSHRVRVRDLRLEGTAKTAVLHDVTDFFAKDVVTTGLNLINLIGHIEKVKFKNTFEEASNGDLTARAEFTYDVDPGYVTALYWHNRFPRIFPAPLDQGVSKVRAVWDGSVVTYEVLVNSPLYKKHISRPNVNGYKIKLDD